MWVVASVCIVLRRDASHGSLYVAFDPIYPANGQQVFGRAAI